MIRIVGVAAVGVTNVNGNLGISVVFVVGAGGDFPREISSATDGVAHRISGFAVMKKLSPGPSAVTSSGSSLVLGEFRLAISTTQILVGSATNTSGIAAIPSIFRGRLLDGLVILFTDVGGGLDHHGVALAYDVALEFQLTVVEVGGDRNPERVIFGRSVTWPSPRRQSTSRTECCDWSQRNTASSRAISAGVDGEVHEAGEGHITVVAYLVP